MSDWLSQTVFFAPNWKWLSLLILLLAGWVLKSMINSVVLKARQSPLKIAEKNPFIPHFLNLDIEKPISWIGLVLFWKASLGFLELSERTSENIFTILKVLLAFYLLRLAYLAVEALGFWLEEHVAKTENTLDDQLAPLATKTLKVFVVVFGILLILQNFGFNVVSVLAGLGLGGLALTLA
ncbi:MAG: mechanosensitive ion channel, partial [Proteobacteria bacterium]|nr:mechanosensitive ion channel [Pseudomonadota bacterium]